MFRLRIQQCFRLGSQFVYETQMQMETLNLRSVPVITDLKRSTSFFNKTNAASLIKSVTSVSNAGRKRGRGKTIGRKIITDLNKGQVIGVGRGNIRWPGLNTGVIQGQDVVNIEKLPPDSNYEANILAQRALHGTKRKLYKVHPLERGWTAKGACGKKFGPPKVSNPESVQDFESTVLEVKFLQRKKNILGTVKSLGIFSITGNRNGILGVGYAKGPDLKTAVNKSVKNAAARLIHFKLENKHTINHDFYYKMGMVKVFAFVKPPGNGLVCHRAIAECCKLIGIEDIYVKVEGSRNKQHTIKAFLLGLLEQKTYQQLADEKQLHVVEFRREKLFFPTVLASPEVVSKTRNEDETFSEYVMGGKLMLRRPKRQMESNPHYFTYLKKSHFRRNHLEVRDKLLVEYDECRSYLADVYPECKCVLPKGPPTKEVAAVEEEIQ